MISSRHNIIGSKDNFDTAGIELLLSGKSEEKLKTKMNDVGSYTQNKIE